MMMKYSWKAIQRIWWNDENENEESINNGSWRSNDNIEMMSAILKIL